MNTSHWKRGALTALICGTLLGVNTAQAEGFGYVGLTYGNNAGSNPNDNDRETSHSFTLDGSYGYRFGGNQTLVFDALYRDDSYSADISDGDLIEAQSQVGLHYLYTLNNGLMLGAFAGYGEAPHPDSNEQYKVAMGGVEFIYNIGDDYTVYGQLAKVDSPGNSNLSSAGYESGEIIRVGAAYSGLERTTVSFNLELGESDEYEDSDEPGEFIMVSLGGQTSLRTNPSWVVNYGARFARFDALGDSDIVYERSVELGIRYIFGATQSKDLIRSGMIGLPYTPLRASAWTPALD